MVIGILNFKCGESIKERKLPVDITMIKEAILKLGHTVRIIRYDKCQLVYDGRTPRVLYNNKKFPKIDVIIPRLVALADVEAKASIIKQFQLMRIPVVNEFLPSVRAKNKLRTLQILSHKGIAVPKTIVIRRFEYLDGALKRIGRMPVILKTPFGSLGVGVAIIESRRSLVSALDILWKGFNSDTILIQEYIRESEGKDIRVFIVGDKIVAIMQRIAKRGEFRSNIYQGGTGKKISLTMYERKLALAAVRALKLDVAGVDLLEKQGGAVVMEVNCNPGLEGITEATGIDVASEIVKYAIKKVQTKNRDD